MKKIGVGNTLYIAYGSNLNLEQMARRCPYAVPIGPAELPGYKLLFRGGKESSVATMEPQEGSAVPVLVWEITPRCEQELDYYEGWPRLYRKETVSVRLDGKPVEAMVYIMNNGWPVGTPGGGYYNAIAEGYATAGFDLAVLDDAVRYSASLAGNVRHPGSTARKVWTSEKCVGAVERFIAEHDRFPRTEDFLKNKALPLPPTFKHHTGETIGEYLKRHPRYDSASDRFVTGRHARLVE